MLSRHVILAVIVILSGCASFSGPAGSRQLPETRLIVSNPSQYPVKVYASRTSNELGWRAGRLAIGGRAAYILPYSGDVFFRLVRLNGRTIEAHANVTPGDIIELEPNPAWDMLLVTIRPRP